jgi:HEAT repeat protein
VSLFLPQLRPTVAAALRDSTSKDPKSRAAAAEALGDAKEAEQGDARAALAALTTDQEPHVRFASLAGLAKLGDGSSVDAILARFEDENAMVREVAVIAAAEIGDARALPRVRKALQDEHPEVRFQAVAALVDLAGEDARVALFAALADDDAKVRANAASCLAKLEDDAATNDRLAKLLEDSAPEARLEAALALAAHRDRRAIRELSKRIGDDDRAFDVIEALAALDATETADQLDRLARSFLKPLTTKAVAAAALAKMKDPRGIPALRDIARAFRSDGRTYVAETIGALGLVELSDELVTLARRPRGADLLIVIEALGKLAKEKRELYRVLEELAKRDDTPGERAREVLRSR